MICILVLVSSCAPSMPPQTVGLEFWKKRTRLDPGCVALVTQATQNQFQKEFLAGKRAMLADHPELARYRFDFSRVVVHTLYRDEALVRVQVTGHAVILGPDGKQIDQAEVDDTFEVVKEGRNWKIAAGRTAAPKPPARPLPSSRPGSAG